MLQLVYDPEDSRDCTRRLADLDSLQGGCVAGADDPVAWEGLVAAAPEKSPRGTCGGQDCQELRGSLGFVGVGGPNEIPRETPAQARKTANNSDAGGGTRTPDTRIMISARKR